jgi:hypothetical protein
MTATPPAETPDREERVESPPKTALLLGDCQRRLAILWLALALPAFILTIIRTVSPHDPLASSAQDAWGWLLASILPTLTLIVGAMAAGAVYSDDERPKERYASRFVYQISLAFSAFYMIIINAMAIASVYDPSMLKTANIYLSALHGLVGAALGAFFVSAKPAKTGS